MVHTFRVRGGGGYAKDSLLLRAELCKGKEAFTYALLLIPVSLIANAVTSRAKLVWQRCSGVAVTTVATGPALSEVPYAESSAWQKGWHSPYITDSHRQLRLAMRAFVEAEIMPDAESNEELGEHPSLELYQKMGQVRNSGAYFATHKYLLFMRVHGGRPCVRR